VWGAFGPKGAVVFFIVLLSWYFVTTRRQNKEIEAIDRRIESAKKLLNQNSTLRAPGPSTAMEERDPPSMEALEIWSKLASENEIFRAGGIAKSGGYAVGPLGPDASRQRLELLVRRLRDEPADEWLASTEAFYYVPAINSERDALRFPWEDVKSIEPTGPTQVAPCSVFVTWRNTEPEGLDLQLAGGADLRIIAMFDEFRRSV
jgi:hypothetical protein